MSVRFDWWKWLVVCAVSMVVLSFFCRCTTTKYVPQIEYHDRIVNKTDSFIKVDSVWLHDSVSVYIRGDTVFKDRFRLQYKDRYIVRNKSDTLLVHDSIPYKANIVTEKKLSSADKGFMTLGKIFSVIIFMGVLAFIGWICWKLKLHK